MKLKQLNEMAKAKACPTCGLSMAANHYWYKGGWKCKSTNAAKAAGTPAAPASAPPASSPAAGATPPSVPAVQPVAAPVKAPVAAAPAKAVSSSSPKSGAKNVHEWLKANDIENYSIRPDNKIDVKADVFLQVKQTKLPVQFGNVNGDFVCVGGLLTTLEGSPEQVDGDYMLHHHHLESFVGAPKVVGGDVDLSNNPASSVEGLPERIGKNLNLQECEELTSLKGIHKAVKEIGGGTLHISTYTASHVLGLLMIKGLKEIKGTSSFGANASELSKVVDILNKHLQGERDVNLCQEELLDAGYGAFAKL